MWRLVIVLFSCIGLTTFAAAQQAGRQDAYCNASPQDVNEVRGLLVTLGYETEAVEAGCGPLMQEAIRAFWSGVGRAPRAAISPDLIAELRVAAAAKASAGQDFVCESRIVAITGDVLRETGGCPDGAPAGLSQRHQQRVDEVMRRNPSPVFEIVRTRP